MPTDAITWAQQVNVTAVGSQLTKSGGSDGAQDAGAISQTITTLPCEAAFIVGQTNKTLNIGISNQLDNNTSAANIDFGFWVDSSGVVDMRTGTTWLEDAGSYTTSTILMVRVESDRTVKWYKDGVLKRTSSAGAMPAVPLVADITIQGSGGILSSASLLTPNVSLATTRYARLGSLARLATFRLGYYQPWVRILINGVDRSSGTFVNGVTIIDELNHAPNTATFRCRGFTPLQGQEVKLYLGGTGVDQQLFGGHILNLEQGFEGKPAAPNVYWQVSCIDYTWLLSRRPAIKKYNSQSATAIVLDLMGNYTAGFTTTHVATGLASLDEITFTNEDVPDALTRITERIGGYWYVDYGKDLHLFLTEAFSAVTVGDSSKTASDIKQAIDLSQVATRVTVRGGGSNTASDVAVGQTTLPVEDSSWYGGGGGVVEVGPQRVTYTGIAAAGETGSTTGFINPPAAPAGGVFYGAGGGTLTASSTYLVAWAYITAEGVAMAPPVAVALTAGQTQIQTDTAPMPTDPKITLKAIYLSTSNGNQSTMKKFTDYAIGNTGVPTIILNSAATGIAAPTANTAGPALEPTPAGSTSLQVENLALFAASGLAEVGGIVFSYTGRSATTGAGTLTGIPASGVGSLSAAVRSGTVRSIPHLTGVSGILYAIPKGEPVNIVVTVNDTTAQTALAALVGGDGIHEMFLTDGRWSITEATARATAELSQRKDPLVTVHLTSRDPNMVSGRNVTITKTHPAISGTFKIQRVTISLDVPTGKVFPIRQVECSSRQYSFEDLLRRVKATAA